jgi:selenocysteine-specific elongation factor
MPREELRSRLAWPHALWPPTLRSLVAANRVREHGALVALPDHRGGTAGRRDEADRVLAVLRGDLYAPPSGAELAAATGADAGLLAAMVEEGEIVRVAEGIYLAREAYDAMLARTLDLLRDRGEVTVGALRDSFGTSRKYALNFLEHLDALRITRRAGDVRLPGSKAPAWS